MLAGFETPLSVAVASVVVVVVLVVILAQCVCGEKKEVSIPNETAASPNTEQDVTLASPDQVKATLNGQTAVGLDPEMGITPLSSSVGSQNGNVHSRGNSLDLTLLKFFSKYYFSTIRRKFQTSNMHSVAELKMAEKLPKELGSMSLSEPNREAAVMVAIDFGTTYSGYAFMFTSDPTSLYTAMGEEREPTCVLLNPDKTFNAFGKQALENYAELEPEEHQSYYFFHHFKMKLYESKKLTRETTLQDQTGMEMKAMDVYSIVLQYFHTRVIERVGQVKSDQAIKGFSSKQILWMLSIPAIWTDSARQFMREAATKGEMENVRLVLEPEAGALFAIDKPLKLRDDKSTEKFPVGHKYILADLGGGTIDICVHEILDGRRLCELYRATGDYAGGSRVNHEFERFFVSLFGAPALHEFRTKFTHSYQDFIKSVETKKCAFSQSTVKITLTLDYDFVTLVENDNGETIEKMIKGSRYKDRVQYRNTGRRLTVNQSVVKEFFDRSVDIIVDKLKEILSACPQDNITSLLLVGGYSESPYVRERIHREFPQLTTVMVEDGRLAVMKGAVMMGLKPRNIIQRRARFTYGFIFNPKFIEGEHPEQFKVNVDSETTCEGMFKKLIEQGQLLQHQQEFSKKYYITFIQPESKQLEWHILLWRSPRPNPRYCCLEEDQCEVVGMIPLPPPSGGWPDVIHSVWKLIVGETEFTLKMLIKETDEEYEAHIDFL